MPCLRNAARSAPTVNSGGLSTTSEYLSGPDRDPIVPRTLIDPSFWRTALMRPLPPLTTRTLFSTGIVVVAGSSVTTARPPPGSTDTHTRFSLSDSADTRAAYEAPR